MKFSVEVSNISKSLEVPRPPAWFHDEPGFHLRLRLCIKQVTTYKDISRTVGENEIGTAFAPMPAHGTSPPYNPYRPHLPSICGWNEFRPDICI